MVLICRFRNSTEIFAIIVNGCKFSAILIKSSNWDIDRVSGSTTGKEWNTGLDLKLKFTMLFITCLKREERHKILEKVSTDYKLRNLLQFYQFLFIRTLFPYLLKSPPGKLNPSRCLQILRTFYKKQYRP